MTEVAQMNDYSQYPLSDRIYTGSEEKVGITIDNQYFIVKFQKNSETGLLNNHLSEHLGSSIFNLIGEEAQKTTLGTFRGKAVVLCKDFNNSREIFVPFNGVGESTLERDKEMYTYSYEDIILMLQDNSKLTNVQETIEKFWNMYIIDALIGNFDRHGSNWGFLKSGNSYRLAPIFDNGSSLFPRRNTEELMSEVITNKTLLDDMTFKYPTSQIRINNKKSSYFEIIHSLQFEECNKALKRMYLKIDINKICQFIDTEDELTNTQKMFYKHILKYRYEHIIKKSYLILMEG